MKAKPSKPTPELTENAKRIINRLCSLLRIDDELLKSEIGWGIEAAFLEGHKTCIENKGK